MRAACNFWPKCIWITLQSGFNSFSSSHFVFNIVRTVCAVASITIYSWCKTFTIPAQYKKKLVLCKQDFLMPAATMQWPVHCRSNSKKWKKQIFISIHCAPLPMIEYVVTKLNYYYLDEIMHKAWKSTITPILHILNTPLDGMPEYLVNVRKISLPEELLIIFQMRRVVERKEENTLFTTILYVGASSYHFHNIFMFKTFFFHSLTTRITVFVDCTNIIYVFFTVLEVFDQTIKHYSTRYAIMLDTF